jgi:hypothetical protein
MKMEEALGASLGQSGRFSDELMTTTCGRCGTKQSLADSNLEEGEERSVYRCSCGEEIAAITPLPGDKFEIHTPFELNVRHRSD